MSRCRHPESPRFSTSSISVDVDIGKAGKVLLDLGRAPAIEGRSAQQKRMHRDTAATSVHDVRQLSKARPRANAAGMQEDHQGRPMAIKLDSTPRRPANRRRTKIARMGRVRPQGDDPCKDDDSPGRQQEN
ncbi:MAG: hypothetical protein ACHRXM_27690 [Isosphaerales bacterium]